MFAEKEQGDGTKVLHGKVNSHSMKLSSRVARPLFLPAFQMERW